MANGMSEWIAGTWSRNAATDSSEVSDLDVTVIDLSAIGDWKGQLLNIVNTFEGINLVGSIALLGAAVGLVQVARGRLRLSPPC